MSGASSWLETELSSDLQGARGSVGAQKRSEDAGRRGDRSIDKSELRVGDVANRLIEIGMVQYVERLAK